MLRKKSHNHAINIVFYQDGDWSTTIKFWHAIRYASPNLGIALTLFSAIILQRNMAVKNRVNLPVKL
ncbi:hypothetical protein SAMN05216387_11519 [Nitrosovibrio tenuis]|uniref:Uncharacterized protein n=1 Tax=Nitrosovibrio tenuis TaxID=1233 RepID=A0A1H7R5U6_9PROT|nr:hypothetical protein SAMN05216387_11519 [Nitrosovibrio tenuis]